MKNNIEILKTSKSPFPSIDFNFRNNGNVTALISEFSIIIQSCKINFTPVFDFSFDIANRNKDFVVYGTNNGWGDAKQTELKLEHKILETLFPKDELVYRGSLGSLNTKEIFRLSTEKIEVDNFKELQNNLKKIELKKLKEKFPEYLSWNKHMTVENGYNKRTREESYIEYKLEEIRKFNQEWEIGIPLKNILVNKNYAIKYQYCSGFDQLYITKCGFILRQYTVKHRLNLSDATYCSLIDTDDHIWKKSYRISRKIPPNDLDRFHITIGATKSCDLNIKFQFTVDEKKKINSEEFIIKIWNPYNSGYLAEYKDGEVFIEENNRHNLDFLLDK